VRIVGAIKVAGSYELKPNWRFMDVVAMAGGLSTKTTRISGRVIRSGNVIPLNVEQAAAKPADSANLLLKPNDLVMLDERDITKQINVIGQVRTPGAFDLTEDLNIITLVNQAGGPTEKAALRKAYVQRAGSVIDIDLYNTLMEGGVDSSTAKFKFEPGDVLVVPENDARFTVTGHVATPGLYPLPEKKDAATVLKALVAAGNQTADADLSGASLTRIVDGQPTVIPVNIADMLTGKRADDVILQPGDLLYIPKANRQLTVSGKVAKPGVYEIKEGQSLISLIAEAGGTAEGAALRSAYIMRNGQQLPVDLYPALVEGKSDVTVNDLAFRPGDVLVIPENRVRYAVLGQVASPNYYSYPENRREATLLKALSAAGGPVRESNLTRVGIIRTVNGQPTVTEVNVQDMLSKGALGSNVLLQPEDIVYIPAKTKGFSWGTILQPLGALRMILGGGIF
jgi:protein involved in polysaccharide export with SLBB domain